MKQPGWLCYMYKGLCMIVLHRLGGGFKQSLFSPIPGEMIQID